MAVPNFLQLHGLGGDLGRLQAHLVLWMHHLRSLPFLTGNDLVSETDANGATTNGIVFIGGTEKAVPHKLGKKPQRCFLTRVLSGSPDWFESFPADANYVYLTFAVNSIVYLRVE